MPSSPVQTDARSTDCSISLRIRHPSIDPDKITTTLGLTPEHCWASGEPRKSDTGARLGGMRRETYWSASLPRLFDQQRAAASGYTVWHSAAASLALQVASLKRHRAFLEQIVAEQGEASMVIQLAPEEGGALRMDAALMRQLAELSLVVEFEFVLPSDADS